MSMDNKALNARLAATNLRTCLRTDEMAKLELLKDRRGRLKRVFILKGSASIRLHLGGPIYIGLITHFANHAEKILRYADMAALHFRRYKLRGVIGEAKDREFNFSVARAKLDLEMETGLKEILVDLEKDLLRSGQILPADELDARRKADAAKQANNLSRMVQFEASLAALDKKVDVLVQGMTVLLNKVKEDNKPPLTGYGL